MLDCFLFFSLKIKVLVSICLQRKHFFLENSNLIVIIACAVRIFLFDITFGQSFLQKLIFNAFVD
jgi:hypothetical protein